MNATNTIIWIWIIAILYYKEAAAAIDKRCQHLRKNRLLTGSCIDLNLREVPDNLQSGIERLEVNSNKIKKLKKSSFENYGSVRFIILFDNKIQSVEPGTFSELTSLEEVDLADNSLVTIPMELFQLPAMRNLYVDSNELAQLSETLAIMDKPIRAPLEYLNIANCGLTKIPDLGLLPYLSHLNASQNALSEVTAQSLVPMCSIKSVDLKQTHMDPCACKSIVQYLEGLGVNVFDRVDCDIIDEETCHLQPVDTNDFQQCKLVIESKKAQNMWIYIACGVGGMLFLCLGILICCHNQNKTKRNNRLRNINRQSSVAATKCDEELLKGTNNN